MKSLSDQLVEDLSSDGIIDIVNFGKCLRFSAGDVLKIFRPRTKGRFGSMLLDGDIGFILTEDVPGKAVDKPRIPRPKSLSVCPMMNLPDLVKLSALEDGRVSPEFVSLLRAYISKVPGSVIEIRELLGADFLEKATVERVPALANFLRKG